ncbi:RRXRR domain-containing protein [Methanohalobium sp.]|nr:RRXRR domain-containing protein [Methanohalobium sp.]
MVFVLNKNKKLLTPCHPAKARILLKAEKATIHKKYPFTISGS